MEAKERLARTYWFPCYAYVGVFLKQRGSQPELASDIVQEFFAERFFDHLVPRADGDSGRFRAFLCSSLANYTKTIHRYASAQRRAPAGGMSSIDEPGLLERFENSLSRFSRPEDAFDRAWVMGLLEEAKQNLREAYQGPQRRRLLELLEPFLELSEPAESSPYEELSRKAGMSEGAFKVTVHRFRKRYRELVELAIARTVGWRGNTYTTLLGDLRSNRHLARLFQEERRTMFLVMGSS